MKKGTFFTYRFLGAFVALMAYMGFFLSVFRLFGRGLDRKVLVYVFVFGCMVIYSVLSRLFSQMVIRDGKPLKRSLLEWIIANAAVVIVGAGYTIYLVKEYIMTNPAVNQMIQENVKTMMANKSLKGADPGMLVHASQAWMIFFFGVFLAVPIIHAVWSLFLVKRYKDYFQ